MCQTQDRLKKALVGVLDKDPDEIEEGIEEFEIGPPWKGEVEGSK